MKRESFDFSQRPQSHFATIDNSIQNERSGQPQSSSAFVTRARLYFGFICGKRITSRMLSCPLIQHLKTSTVVESSGESDFNSPTNP